MPLILEPLQRDGVEEQPAFTVRGSSWVCLRETRLSHVPWITHAALRAVETEEGRASVAMNT